MALAPTPCTMTTADLLLYRTWLTDRLTSTAWSSTVSPLAARNTQYLKEQFGTTEEKVCLSPAIVLPS